MGLKLVIVAGHHMRTRVGHALEDMGTTWPSSRPWTTCSRIWDSGIVAAPEADADDYVTEPFEVEEITARLRALRRRARTGDTPDGLRDVLLEAHPHDPLVLSPHNETVRRSDLHLTSTEYRLLHELAHAPGRVLNRRALLERVWNGNVPGNRRVVDVHVRRLRTKIEQEPACPRVVVVTVRGFGYRLDVRV